MPPHTSQCVTARSLKTGLPVRQPLLSLYYCQEGSPCQGLVNSKAEAAFHGTHSGPGQSQWGAWQADQCCRCASNSRRQHLSTLTVEPQQVIGVADSCTWLWGSSTHHLTVIISGHEWMHSKTSVIKTDLGPLNFPTASHGGWNVFKGTYVVPP